MRTALLALPLLIALPAFAGDDHGHDDHAHDDHAHEEHAHDDHDDHWAEKSDHLSEVDGLRILHAWTNATEGDHARVYMDIENTGTQVVTLKGGDAEIAGEVHLMAMDIANPGTFAELEEMPIPAKSEFMLAPNMVFLELHEIATHLHKGEAFDMHVMIEPFGEIEIHVEVEAEDANQHSHAGHNH
jgi:copper(I)-binding protein